MAPLVTVITATYNSSALLKLSLSSLVSQEYGSFEAWVVGDACTDDSGAVVASFGDPRLHWTNLSRNSGSQAAPNNEGMARAQGSVIAFLGHDDLWFPWHLASLVSRHETTNADVVHALAAILDREGPCSASASPPPNRSYRDHGVPPSAWLIRRETARRLGPWADPASLARAVDHDYWRRAALAGAAFAFSPRLSVLKFPSPLFGSYAQPASLPQPAYLAAMQQDAGQLERQVLTELAVAFGQHPLQTPERVANDRELLTRAFRATLRRRVDRWQNAPLVAGLMRRRYQRIRRQQRRVRGLD